MFLTSSARLLALVAVSAGLVSCETGATKSSSSVSDPYVSNYPADGGYNPYPGQPGRVTGGGSSSVPSYETPVAPVEADPYAFHGSSSTPSRSTPTRSTTSSSSSTPRKTVASSTKPKSSTSTKAKSTAKKSTGSSTHTVAKGDTLYGLAIKNKTTVAKIKAASGLTSDLIRPGQKLKLR
ncbi:MAG: LysM peptidoglycan-binding domain-containing protein [Verrucomicrobiota bacterium]